jgi:hypothetical protein
LILQIVVFWILTPFSFKGRYQRSEDHTASVFKVEMAMARFYMQMSP